MTAEPVTLASASAIRRRILEQAGVDFDVARPQVDEAAIKARMLGRGADAPAVARALAEAKALDIAGRTPGLVIGADQVMRMDGALYDKAASMREARARLAAMAGREHELIGSVVIARAGKIVRGHDSVSRLRVRAFSEEFLDDYLDAAGEEILASVGCYQYEGLGAQLFDRVEGDYFAILGLPLLPVLEMLRAEGALPE